MKANLALVLLVRAVLFANGRCNAQEPKERATLQGHTGTVASVAFNNNGTLLASASNDATIKLWDVKTGQEKASLKGQNNIVGSVVFNPDCTLLGSGSWDRTIKLWDIPTTKKAGK